MPSFGRTSKTRLHECHPDLIRLFEAVVEYYDCTVLEGHRPESRQTEYFTSTPQRSKVPWPQSKHNSYPSNAIDAAPWPIPDNWGEDHMKDLVKFYEFAAIVRYEAARQGIRIRWGGDWDSDGNYKDQKFDDLVHFELVG